MTFFQGDTLSWLALCLFSYGCGSIPTGVLISRLLGGPRDIRNHGSAGTGATNVLRVAGRTAAALTVGLDILKAALPVLWAMQVAEPLAPLVGLCAVLGHVFPVFLAFRGGKGVASALGVLLVLSWGKALGLLGLWGVVMIATRYVSLASVGVALVAPLLFWGTGAVSFIVVLMGALLVWAHRENIKRLWHGRESQVEWKKGRKNA